MRSRKTLVALVLGIGVGAVLAMTLGFTTAQPPQIPTMQAPNQTKADGIATVAIDARKDSTHSGTFEIRLKVSYDPATDDYPSGTLSMKVDLSDSLKCSVSATTFEQVTTTGKHTPTVLISGRCKVDPAEKAPIPDGCQYWVLIADNGKENVKEKHTPDVVSFLVVDKTGKRIAYGTGPVIKGDLNVAPTSN